MKKKYQNKILSFIELISHTRVALIVALTFGTMAIFQNCSKVSFQKNTTGKNFGSPDSSDNLPNGTLTINDGKAFTNNQQLKLKINYQNTTAMALSEGSCPDRNKAEWQQPKTQIEWEAEEHDGQKNIYLLLRGSSDEISSCIKASIILDQEIPTVEVVHGPRSLSKENSASFVLNPNDNISGIDKIYCQLSNENSFSTCETEFQKQELKEGSQSLNIYVADKAGNISAPISYSWFVDLTPPSVEIIAPFVPTNLLMNSTSVYFQGNDKGSGVKDYLCSLNNIEIPHCRSPLVLNQLSDGAYTFKVVAIDEVGFLSLPAQFQFTVDTQPSGDFHIFGVTGGSDTNIDHYLATESSPTLHWSISSGAQSYELSILSLDKQKQVCGVMRVSNPSDLMAVLNNCILVDGTSYVAKGVALRNGRTTTAPDFVFTVDRSAPKIEILSLNKFDEMKKVKIDYRVSDAGSGLKNVTCYKKYKNDISLTNCLNLNTIEYSNLLPGDYQFYISATDQLDHMSQSTTLEFRISCPEGQTLIDGICKNTAFNECIEFVELSLNTSPIVIPDLASTGKCFYKKIISAVNPHPSGSAGEIRAMDVWTRDHNSLSYLPIHPFIMGDTQLTFLFQGARTISLASSASADLTQSPLKIDNFFLVETTPQNTNISHLLARGTADSEPWKDQSKTSLSPILVNEVPVIDFKSYAPGGTATVPYIDVSNNFSKGIPTTLRVRQLDCGGSAESSQVFLIIR